MKDHLLVVSYKHSYNITNHKNKIKLSISYTLQSGHTLWTVPAAPVIRVITAQCPQVLLRLKLVLLNNYYPY